MSKKDYIMRTTINLNNKITIYNIKETGRTRGTPIWHAKLQLNPELEMNWRRASIGGFIAGTRDL